MKYSATPEEAEQFRNFDKYLPEPKPEEYFDFENEFGRVVSIHVFKEHPDGVSITFATKSHTFGPMRLTQIAAERLRKELCEKVTYIERF